MKRRFFMDGLGSAGDTEEEAIANAKEALAFCFKPSPVKLRNRAKLVEVTVS